MSQDAEKAAPSNAGEEVDERRSMIVSRQPVTEEADGADGKKKKQPIKIDLLDEDPRLNLPLTEEQLSRRIFKERFAVVAFVSPEGVNGAKIRLFKVRGVYETEKEANAAAEQFRALDGGKFNLFIGPVGIWLEVDPDPKNIRNQVFADEKQQQLMKGYLENMEKGAKVHKERLAESHARNQRSPGLNEVLDRMRGELERKKQAKAAKEAERSSNDELASSQTEKKERADQVNEEDPLATLSAEARKRAKKRMETATEEEIIKERELYEKKLKVLEHMRQEIARKKVDQQTAKEVIGESAPVDATSDVLDIQKMVAAKVAEATGRRP